MKCSKKKVQFNHRTKSIPRLLTNFILSTIVKEKQCSITESLEHFKETTIKFGVQGPFNHRSDQDRLNYYAMLLQD